MPRRRQTISAVDRISALPDAVLCHILSFLPTRHAVTTSVLSKRWNPLWRSVPALDFSDEDVRDDETASRFNEFVYSVLVSRDATPPIARFRLVSSSEYLDFSGVNKWINFALQRGVEDLHLEVKNDYEMPNISLGILSCTTLVVLKLEAVILNDFSSVALPSLKVLHMKSVTIPVKSFIKLLSECPILEDLLAHIDCDPCTLKEYKSLSLPKLIRADILPINPDFRFPLKAIYNVEFMRLSIDSSRNGYIPTFRNLTHMELYFECYNWPLIVKVLNQCPKLRTLALENNPDFLGEDDEEIWVEPDFVPECLSLHLRACTLTNYEGLEGELMFARYVMKNARALQTMTIWSSEKDPMRIIKMLKELTLCTRSSDTCQLRFEQ